MKFARELDQDAVPEWKAKYLNYKQCKKKLKAVDSALRDLNRTPLAPSVKSNDFSTPSGGVGTGLLTEEASRNHSKKRRKDVAPDSSDNTETEATADNHSSSKARDISKKGNGHKRITSQDPLVNESDDNNGRRNWDVGKPRMTKYGSIIGSPPKGEVLEGPLPSLKLPDPALSSVGVRKSAPKSVRLPDPETNIDDGAPSPSAYEAGKARTPGHDRVTFRGNPFRKASTGTWDRVRFRRLLSIGERGQSPHSRSNPDLPLNMHHEFDNAQASFFKYMDSELDKIEEFYQEKEDEATKRLGTLREQLHILRDRRIADLNKPSRAPNRIKDDVSRPDGSSDSDEPNPKKQKPTKVWKSAVDRAWDSAINGRVGKQTKVMEGQTTPKDFRPLDDRRDYERRAQDIEVPYRTAKRKLKLAMQEYYRSLELLKSYTLLNRTAFRKINKKYDKTVNVGPTGRYMTERVSNAHFIKSDMIDGYITVVEDLYSRYFEAGNHKVAANKLRKASRQKTYHGGAMFRNGMLIALGCVWGIEGIVAAGQLLFSEDPTIAVQTSFLLQIYGGYFFMVMLMLFFCMACQFWSRSKVNYVFVFEFDTREHLDWRQLLEIPCLCFAFLGFFLWINFSRYGDHDMFIYLPVVLIVASFFVLFCPFPIIYSKARLWFLNACFRLFFSGLYPVEFRDFFLGDMFCSLVYSMGNIELFFCLYANSWENPSICNSSHSRLLGFFTTLPGIWRAFQCLRRYYDTRNVFPHLVNCGKYLCTIIFYMSLSLYRIHKTTELYAVFVLFGVINATYTTVWDLVMDWSLLNPYAKKRFLRDTLAYKQTWIYYVALVVDPILRFNWIFYAIFAGDLQHSALLSFFVSFSEVCRRGMWIVFRVENEHCTNVGRFRASRDIPLPFNLHSPDAPSALESGHLTATPEPLAQIPATPAGASTGTRITPATTTGSENVTTPSLRRRKIRASPRLGALARVGSILHNAHAQDFERRKKNEDVVDASAAARGYANDDDGDTTDEEVGNVMDLEGSDIGDHEGEGENGLHRLASRGKGKTK